MSIHPLRVGALLLASSLLLAAGAGATTLANLSISNGSTPNVFNDAGPPARFVAQSTTSVLASGGAGFDTHYAAVVGADAGNGNPGTSGNYTQNFTGSFTITFEVTQTAGWNWTVNVDVVRNGALTIIEDGTGNGRVTLNALNVVHSGAGVLGASLSLGAVGTNSNAGDPGNNDDQSFSQNASAAITGVGTGAGQVVTLVFSFTASAVSVDPAGGFRAGDEAALRMGIDSALQFFDADDYPSGGTGVGSRTLANDGIFVSAAVPEPAAEALLALGLIGLAWFENRRSPSR
jgi:hypothetical protein